MGSSTYTGIESDLGLSSEAAILTISLFVMGLGVGPLLLGPLSEFVGRNYVYWGSFVSFIRTFLSFLERSIERFLSR